MLTLRIALEIMLLPAAAVVAVFVFARVIARRSGPRPGFRWPGRVAVGLAYVTAHGIRFGWPAAGQWTAIEAWQWLFFAVAAATVLAVIEAIPRRPFRPRWLLRALLVLLLVLASLHPFLRHSWQRGEAVGWISGLVAACVVWWGLLECVAARRQGRAAAPQLLIVAASTAVVLVLNGSQRLAEMAVILSAALAAASLFGCRIRRRESIAGVSAVAPILLAGLWLNGFFFLDLSRRTIALLALAPLAAEVRRIPLIAGLKPWRVGLISTLAVLGLSLAAVIPEILDYQPDPYAY